ncbi:hypothetical protein G6M02_08265 [Agrobacterium rhizogenes]|nr:hypothetical protein [Rhizobium rhizogenes]
MASHNLTDETCIEALDALERHGGSFIKAARSIGIPRQTLQHRVETARLRELSPGMSKVEMPTFVLEGDEEEDIGDILDRKSKIFERKRKAQADRDWFKIRINETKPYGIIAFGDAHLDDDGANIPLLRRHLAIAAKPGVYGINIGDSANNWVGRLERLYAHQETTRHIGRRLIEWFMWESGVSWLCWVMGNHDVWNEGADFHARLAQNKIPVIDWKAQFELVHPSGRTARIDASHGRKGSSQWNNLHATLKAATLGELADAYLTGHTHNYGCEDLEIAERKHSSWLVQLRGYKFMDSYALYNNFAEHQRGSSVFLIIDPSENAIRPVVQCFEDVELGFRVLEMMRAS